MRANELSAKFEKHYPDLSNMLRDDIEDSLSFMNYPIEHWARIKTTNVIERLNAEIKRRTDVVRIFPSSSSALRLIASVCLEKNEEWITGKKYLNKQYLRILNKMKKEKENKKILAAVT